MKEKHYTYEVATKDLISFANWIVDSKIPLCDRRCEYKKIKGNLVSINSSCSRQMCPDTILSIIMDRINLKGDKTFREEHTENFKALMSKNEVEDIMVNAYKKKGK